MDFELFQNGSVSAPNTVKQIVNLVNSGAYASNASFYRVIQNFMIQGGAGFSGTGSDIPVELNPDLRYTSSGLLAMANNGADGNSSEFFVTGPSVDNVTSTGGSVNYADMGDGFLDFRYTIFGKLIAGDDVRQAIAATPVTINPSGEVSQPVTPVIITSMSILPAETNTGVFMFQAVSGATGTYSVTVNDGTASQTFTVNVGTNAFDPPNPWVRRSTAPIRFPPPTIRRSPSTRTANPPTTRRHRSTCRRSWPWSTKPPTPDTTSITRITTAAR